MTPAAINCLRIDAMTDDEVADYLRIAVDGYVRQRVDLGGEDEAEATRIATEQMAEYFPDGHPGEGHHVFAARIVDTGERVGVLWLSEQQSGSGPVVWIYDIEIDADRRGSGFGRELLRLAEAWARERGAAEIRLNVFGGNDVARRLYLDEGFVESAVRMAKKLDS